MVATAAEGGPAEPAAGCPGLTPPLDRGMYDRPSTAHGRMLRRSRDLYEVVEEEALLTASDRDPAADAARRPPARPAARPRRGAVRVAAVVAIVAALVAVAWAVRHAVGDERVAGRDHRTAASRPALRPTSRPAVVHARRGPAGRPRARRAQRGTATGHGVRADRSRSRARRPAPAAPRRVRRAPGPVAVTRRPQPAAAVLRPATPPAPPQAAPRRAHAGAADARPGRRSSGSTDDRDVAPLAPRLRAAAALPRWLLLGCASAGIVASVRFALAPPRPVTRTVTVGGTDRALEATALAVVRAWLALEGARPDVARDRVAALVGDDAAAAIAPDAPPIVRQRVRWAETVTSAEPGTGGNARRRGGRDRSRRAAARRRDAAARKNDGALELVGAPALVGGPVVGPADADPDARRAEVADPALADVCRRALDNYLAGAARNLAADRPTAPREPARCPASPRTRPRPALERRPRHGRRERRGARRRRRPLRAALELAVIRTPERWEIAAIDDPAP